MKYFLFSILGWLLCSTLPAQTVIADQSFREKNAEDLAFLKEELQGKNIICLGEEWHRTETFSQLKNRMVKYLHRELGYTHLIFESSVYGPIVVSKIKKRNSMV